VSERERKENEVKLEVEDNGNGKKRRNTKGKDYGNRTSILPALFYVNA
jgi:hypothetical protein